MKSIDILLNKEKIGRISVNETTTLKEIIDKSKKIVSNLNINPDIYNLNFKFSQTLDLPTYVLFDKEFENISPFNQMVNGESYLIYNKVLTGITNTDLLILEKLNDRDLFNFCISNKYISKLCQNENFWKNRFKKVFDHSMTKPDNQSWKQRYLEVVRDLDLYPNANPWDFFQNVYWDFINPPKLLKIPNNIEKTLYEFLNLGKNINIVYSDRYNIYDAARTYKSDTYFTPKEVMKILNEYYNEPVPLKVFRERKMYYNLENYPEEDVIDGKLKWKDTMGGSKFIGFKFIDGNYFVTIGHRF